MRPSSQTHAEGSMAFASRAMWPPFQLAIATNRCCPRLPCAPLCNPDLDLEAFPVRLSSRREAGRDAQPGDDLASPKNRLGAGMPQPLIDPGFFHVQQEQMGNRRLSAPSDIPPKWHCNLL